MAIVEGQPLSPQDLRTRNIVELTRTPETQRASVVVTTDVEGPLFLGDFIAEAMDEYLHPKVGAVHASPSYGTLIYSKGWDWFTGETGPTRRGNGFRTSDRTQLSLSQEGTDTIFTLPMLLAAGATYEDLERLTLQSKETPGAKTYVDALRSSGAIVSGITTAPVDPYKRLFAERGINANRLMGSPFPFNETKHILIQNGQYERELAITSQFLEGAYQIIDDHSSISIEEGEAIRHFSDEGDALLQTRIGKYIYEDLGVTYNLAQRQSRGPAPTIVGQIIEESPMVGHRAKGALAQFTARNLLKKDGVWIAVGDGVNDAVMLGRAPISIGLNGADAARAAKIGVITDNVKNLLPIIWEAASGNRNIDSIIAAASRRVDSSTEIVRGGPDLSLDFANRADYKKKESRGTKITY